MLNTHVPVGVETVYVARVAVADLGGEAAGVGLRGHVPVLRKLRNVAVRTRAAASDAHVSE